MQKAAGPMVRRLFRAREILLDPGYRLVFQDD